MDAVFDKVDERIDQRLYRNYQIKKDEEETDQQEDSDQ